jgi:hypothetical protein
LEVLVLPSFVRTHVRISEEAIDLIETLFYNEYIFAF